MEIINKCSTVHTSSKPKREIKYIVIHYTAGTTSRAGTAANTAEYYRTVKREVSCDYTVDDKYAVCYNGDIPNRYTWHCGGSKYNTKGGSYYGKCTNANSIGIEICSTNSTGKMQNANDKSYSFTAAAVDNAVDLCRLLMKWHNIPPENVIRHYDVTGKPCPGIYGWNADSGSEQDWKKFKARITNKSTTESTGGDVLHIVSVGAFTNMEYAKMRLADARKYYPDAVIIDKKKG